jgi:ribonuclease E
MEATDNEPIEDRGVDQDIDVAAEQPAAQEPPPSTPEPAPQPSPETASAPEPEPAGPPRRGWWRRR